MRIQWMDTVVGVAAGALDEGMEQLDDNKGYTKSFEGFTDWSRVGLLAAGYLGQAFNIMPRIADPLSIAEATLVTKSVGKVIRDNMSSKSSATATVTHNTASGSVSRRVAWRPKPVGN